MDGAYISDDRIIEKKELDKTEYTKSEIYCKRREDIIIRNEIKRANIDRIYLQPIVWKSVAYKTFFMSCNLDHVLYDIQNSDDDAKKNNSISFSKKYRDNLDGFIDYISNSSFSVDLDYKESWEFIKKENRSLERYTNFGLWISKHRK